ncbi:methyltransferase [Brevibacillus sp. SYSU BS000544]|uniref:methyltransferase n=1 Tax=Brevibacillus sp. SYSU BS000544 TaxID=3416443 RepID=UPI003CE548D3
MYIESGDPLLFGHSLEDQIGGQLRAGFMVADMYEDNYAGRRLFDKYINTFIATRAVKLQRGTNLPK